MKLTKIGALYVVRSTYHERHWPKAANFRWDPVRRQWWTDDPQIAVRLLSVADETCRHELELLVGPSQDHAAGVAPTALPVPDGLQYLPFQATGIAYLVRRANALLADEMGLGKTIQAIGLINADASLRRVLVVCPASLKLNWRRELERWLVRPLSVGIATPQDWPATNIIIVNYDILERHPVADAMWDLVVLDEAHYIKNPKAKRTRIATRLRARRRVYMTGTPIVNRPIELWTLITSLDPVRWPKSRFWYFARRYCAAYRHRFGWDFRGASHLDELHRILHDTLMIRRRKEDVLHDLPPKIRQVIELPANGLEPVIANERTTFARHDEALLSMRLRVELAKVSQNQEEYQEAVAALRRGQRVAFNDMSSVRLETARAKIPLVVEHLRGIIDDEGQKVVVFAHHHEIIAALAAAFGDRAVTLTGDTPLASRQAAVDRFQRDDTCRVFVGSITAAGVGITLTAARICVFAELDWVPGNVTQAEDRLHRIGQRNAVLVQHLVLEGSLDATIARTLVAKQQVIDAVLDRQEAMPDDAAVPIVPEETPTPPRARLERDAATMTPPRIAAIHRALRSLADADPDRASLRNQVGFNQFDSRLGHALAALPSLTALQAALGFRLLIKYRRQLQDLNLAQDLGFGV